jgi:hypothetical protein
MRGFNIEDRRFLQGFNELKEKSEATVDKKRVASYSEDTVTEHFFGAGRLEDVLIATGILDPVTKKIADGQHVIVSRTSLTEGLTPDEISRFDERIHEELGFSAYSLLSLIECGIQTCESRLKRYKKLDGELTARGVPRPVLVMTNNHVSQYHEYVMDYCKSVGILQWSEKPMAVGMLSPLKTPTLPEVRSKKRLTDVSWSVSFNDVIGLKKAKKAEISAAAEAILKARIERAAKTLQRVETTAVNAARKAGEAATLACVWDKCAQGCTCPILFFSGVRVPCVIKGLKKCSACGDIKKSVCQKRQCKEAIAIRELAM